MWRSRVATITGLVIIVAALACGGGGSAVSPTANPTSGAGGGTRIWAFSDGNPVRPASTYAAELTARSAELCQTAEQGTKAMQLPQALASLDAALAGAAGPTALAKLASTQVGKSAAQAETVATAMIAKANPGGALAALLIAHKVDPKEARHLENAAVVATSLGYPQEALALLSGAAGLSESGSPEMGIDRTARMLNNQGYALIRLGRWSEAIPLLKTAIAREPLLNEAQRNLAVALLCIGNAAAAGEAKRAGARRNHFEDIGDPAKPQTFDPAKAYDLSKGKAVKLPALTYPKNLEEAAGAAPKFESDWRKRDSQAKALLSQALAYRAPFGTKSTLTWLRIVHIDDLAGNPKATPQLAQLFTSWMADLQHLLDLTNKWNSDFGNATTDCLNRFGQTGTAAIDCWNAWCAGAQPVAHTGWLSSVKQTDKSLRAWADSYSRFASGLAANLEDPAAHQWVLVDEQYWLISNYGLLLDYTQTWLGIMALGKGSCFATATDAPSETSDGDTAAAVSCTDLIGGATFSLNLEVFTVNVSCEEVGIEGEAPLLEGGLAEAGAFAALSYKFKDGSTTVFAGTYAKTNEIGGLSAGAKGGLYMTWDQGGNMQDVGMRGETSIDQSHGAGSASVSGPDASYSFLGAATED
jgi:tetratricopeptide (TPR) repeat protein